MGLHGDPISCYMGSLGTRWTVRIIFCCQLCACVLRI